MTWIPLTVFGASLLGSLHCLGMCGPIQQSVSPNQTFYHSGRLLSYSALGALAGSLGDRLLNQMQAPAFTLAVGFLFAFTLLIMGIKKWRGGTPLHGRTSSLISKVWRKAFHVQNLKVRSLVFGFLTPLLPCAWLYSFLMGAALTESAVSGAVFMASFCMGTIPALGVLPALKRYLSPLLSQNVNKIAGGLFIIAAIAIVIVRAASVYREVACH